MDYTELFILLGERAVVLRMMKTRIRDIDVVLWKIR